MGDFNQGDIETAVDIRECNEVIAKIYHEEAVGPTIIFAASVNHACRLQELIPEAEVITAETENRRDCLKRFADGKTPVLINCMVLTEGTDLPISYPVMQSDDNDYYLHRAPDGGYLYAGSIFMDYQNDADMDDYNTVIYGHNMRDGSMFAKLKKFYDSGVMDLCPYFWIYTLDGDFLYRIFSVHSVDAVGDTYTFSFDDNRNYAEWFDEMAGESEIDTKIISLDMNRVVTLSTCNGNSTTRLVVQGVLVWQG